MVFKKDFFISYTRRDRSWAEWIAWQLKNKGGYQVELDVWDWLAGDNFVSKMHHAVDEAECTLVVLTNAYFSSAYTEAEWTSTLAKTMRGTGNKLIMVRVEDIQLPGLLTSRLYIDLVGLNTQEASERLLKELKSQRSTPVKKPSFPGKSPRFPGTLPQVWNVPFLRNNHFTGREKILSQLDKTLQSSKTAALIQPQAITGLGGIGKTQVALEYVYRHLDRYDIIWWVHAENPQTLAADYITFAHKVDLPEKDEQKEQVIIDAVKHWLGKTRDWLFVYDNVENPVDIRDYLPQGQTGHVIITSRSRVWGTLCESININTWPRTESTAFLKKRTKYTHKAEINRLADIMGDLPLALEQAAGYITETQIPFAGYIKLFESRRKELWEKENRPPDYPYTVAATWNLAMEKIAEKAPAGTVIMNLCSFLAPDIIPYSLVKSAGDYLPETTAALLTDQLAFNEGIKYLNHYSLAAIQSQSISVHQLVQAVVRDHLTEKKEHLVWIKAAVKVVDKQFPSEGYNDPGYWSECGALITHAQTVAEFGYTYQLALDEVVNLLNNIAGYLFGRAQYKEAEPLFRRALEIVKKQLGSEHPTIIKIRNNFQSLLAEMEKRGE